MALIKKDKKTSKLKAGTTVIVTKSKVPVKSSLFKEKVKQVNALLKDTAFLDS
jgi:hypothetical protein